MARATWPAGLPSPFGSSDPSYTPYDNNIRSKTDSGPGKTRRRFTGRVYKFAFELVLLPAQYTTFWNWFNGNNLDVLPFDWTDFRTNTTKTYKFVSVPTEQFEGGDGTPASTWWKIKCELDTVL